MKKITTICRKATAYLLAAALLSGSFLGMSVTKASAAAPVKLAKKSATLTIKKTDKKTTYGKAEIFVHYINNVLIKTIKYKSSNKKVAKVSSIGTVTAKKPGSAKITVTVRYRKARKNRTKKLTYKVKVVMKDTRKKAKKTTKPKATAKPKTTLTAKPTARPKATAQPSAKPTPNPTQKPQFPVQKNQEEIAALYEIIAEQKALGAHISETDIESNSYLYQGEWDTEDENDSNVIYYWNADGHLVGIEWSSCELSSNISLAEFLHLEYLNCGSNKITSLDVRNNPALKQLVCYSNQLTSLDVSKNILLEQLLCDENQLSSLDTSQNIALKYLQCTENKLISLNVTRNSALTELYCNTNQLTSLDLKSNAALTTLFCHENQLTSLDTSKNTALVNLFCAINQLRTINLSGNTELIGLHCQHNLLTALDISKNVKLVELDCSDNHLTTLDVSRNKNLTNINCDDSVRIIQSNENIEAGLYDAASGRLKMSWEDLLKNGYLKVENGILTAKGYFTVTYDDEGEGEDMENGEISEILSGHLVIPDNVKKIGKKAFLFCQYLTEISLPDSVTTIEEHSFENCDALKNINIPDSVTTIGKETF